MFWISIPVTPLCPKGLFKVTLTEALLRTAFAFIVGLTTGDTPTVRPEPR